MCAEGSHWREKYTVYRFTREAAFQGTQELLGGYSRTWLGKLHWWVDLRQSEEGTYSCSLAFVMNL